MDANSQGAQRLFQRPRAIVRPGQLADASGIARVYVDTWRTSYTGVLPAAYMDRLSYGAQEASWKRALVMPGNATFVAEDRSARIVGFANGGPERGGNPRYFAELYTLYLLQEFHGQGLGRRLVSAFAERLVTIGLRSLLVRVLEANPARGFYESLGAEELESKPVRLGGGTFTELVYGWRDMSVLIQRR